ncbi:leucine-rich repeat neuronal protein 3-like [Scleropages formosus]|uniref:Leucine rich repeat neuronal 3 n=1 Tax=Scleropages formosus TaxID=113540 RepID=A0A8C9UWZ0_SCLFO|nr:leucine-rich repeat neuronal protein 3-like [Scleropages formosus]XP_018585234.1 leucine-rich repeat neuronal protein 3-like [Scleropages formosus]
MKDMLLMVHFTVGLAMTARILAVEEKDSCPQSCVCEIRPWFSPSSVYTELPTVDCNDLGLFLLPERLPANTQVLLLQTNNIAKIGSPLDYLANISEIDVSQNNLSSMDDINLGHLQSLLSLHMEENWVQTLPNGCLAELANLQELYINHNLISFIAPGAFMGLENLLRLHLNSNRLKAISSRWFEATPRLEILMIGENPVVRIEDLNFRPLSNLRSLVLARMNLTEIPDDALVGLERLESISFYDNTFVKVPHVALKKLLSLKFLDLNKNPIQRIQRGDFVDLLHLKELGINSMPELVSIDSFALSNLPELTKIEATNNPKLSYIHPNAFYKLPRLETLMVNGNALSALHRITVESLPSLREVSMHSNPIRCDCVIRWMNMNKTGVRFMEPDSLFCVEPPELEGRRVRQVHAREMTEICLPLISPESLPTLVRVQNGSSLSLHCRAFAEPEPDIYWVTPSGDRILPNSISKKFHMHPEGTLDLYDITEHEAGLYTCVAHNLVGADLKSVSLEVDGYFPQPANVSLIINVEAVLPNSVVLSWKASFSSLSANIKWSATGSREKPAPVFAARVPSDVKVYNLTHLESSTQYQVCVNIPSAHRKQSGKCINVTTKALELAASNTKQRDVVAIAVFAVLLAAASVTCSLVYVSLRKHRAFGELRKSESLASLSPVAGLPSPLLKFWVTGRGTPSAAQVKTTVLDVSSNSL